MIDQISKTKENKKIGELNQTIALYFWTMIDSFLINFIPSTIGCNKPNQPILYGPLLLCKPPITNRSIKANIPTVPSKYKMRKRLKNWIENSDKIVLEFISWNPYRLRYTQLCCWVTPYILYTVSGVTYV